jgi:hypothetical protein
MGDFTDKWGVNQYIPILVGVGVSLSDSDLSELMKWVAIGETILDLDPNPYADDSLEALQDAVNNGKDVLDMSNPTEQQIQEAIQDIKDAIDNLEEKLPDDIIKGNDGNYYRPVGRPPYVYQRVERDGRPTQPPTYVYNPNGTPGDGNDKPAYPDSDGNFWVEDPPGSNIYKQVDPDTGNLIDSPAIWGGEDGKFGTGDDEVVEKIGNDYWVYMGQNVWRPVDKDEPTSLGELTGGGWAENPATDPARPIFDFTHADGKYYLGPLVDENGVYYIGDRLVGGNGKVMSRPGFQHSTDQRFYLVNGQMVTVMPPKSDLTNTPVGGEFADLNGNVWMVLADDGKGNKLIITKLAYKPRVPYNDTRPFVLFENSQLYNTMQTWYADNAGSDIKTRGLNYAYTNGAKGTVGAGIEYNWTGTYNWDPNAKEARALTVANGPMGNGVAFALSISEVNTYFANQSERRANYRWWLRSPGRDSTHTVTEVHSNGKFHHEKADHTRYVRPALWVSYG